MPLHIIRQDITKMKCDAIVNAANETLLGGGGVDGAIHKAAGPELLLECQTLGGCKTGEAKITKGYNLPAKYVIHTVGPVWQGGKFRESEKLISCYVSSLKLARAHGCQTVAFPLVSAGVYGYPKSDAFRIAVNTVKKFLMSNEMTVYIVVYDKDSFILSSNLFYDVAEYIDDKYVGERENEEIYRIRRHIQYNKFEPEPQEISMSLALPDGLFAKKSLENFIKGIDASFSVMLLKLIDAKGMSDVECYKKANVSKQTWYKIMNEKGYKPSRNTVIAFAIALKLTYEETQALLKTVGFTLSKSSIFDIIIEYCLINEIYDIIKINEVLFEFDQTSLGI